MAKELLLFRSAKHPSVTAYTDGRLLALTPNEALLRGVDSIPLEKWQQFQPACETA
jgi:hypothetical protein